MPPRKRTEPIHVLDMDTPARRRGAAEVVARGFSHMGRVEREMLAGRWRGSAFDPAHTRVAMAGDRVASAVVLAPRTVRFGPARVPAMTVGPVATDDRLRKAGYAAAAMNDASRYMAEQGALIGYLQGINDFYHRFGYYPFMAPGKIVFERKHAQREAAAGRLRAMRPADLPAVSRLFEQATAGRIMAAERDLDLWQWLVRYGKDAWLFDKPKVILDARSRIVGYLTARDGRLEARECVVAPNEPAWRAALGALVREARRRESPKIGLPMPWDEPMAVFLRQFVGAEFTCHANPVGGALLKIVDLAGLMAALEPLLTERWLAAGRRQATRFTLASELGAVGLALTSRTVRVAAKPVGPRVHIPQRWLSGLVTGYYTVTDVAPRKGAKVPADLTPVLETLFPPACPFVYQGDNY